jgi:HlyD family secretion protein
MIRDTSHQDAVIAAPPNQKLKRNRLRIAEVGRGTLVRDASVNGRVVAAVSPTLYLDRALVHRQR